MPNLVFFDLDHTLISVDSDHLFGQFLADHSALDTAYHQQQSQRFYEDYSNQSLDMDAYLNFALRMFDAIDYDQLLQLRQQFVEQKIRPQIYQQGLELIAHHRQNQDTLVVTTATNRFVVEPIVAELLNIEHLICTEIARHNGRFVAKSTGLPNYAANKVTNIKQWLQANSINRHLFDASIAYSDSINDRPLLEFVDQAVAVNADPKLHQLARHKRWKIITFKH